MKGEQMVTRLGTAVVGPFLDWVLFTFQPWEGLILCPQKDWARLIEDGPFDGEGVSEERFVAWADEFEVKGQTPPWIEIMTDNGEGDFTLTLFGLDLRPHCCGEHND